MAAVAVGHFQFNSIILVAGGWCRYGSNGGVAGLVPGVAAAGECQSAAVPSVVVVSGGGGRSTVYLHRVGTGTYWIASCSGNACSWSRVYGDVEWCRGSAGGRRGSECEDIGGGIRSGVGGARHGARCGCPCASQLYAENVSVGQCYLTSLTDGVEVEVDDGFPDGVEVVVFLVEVGGYFGDLVGEC